MEFVKQSDLKVKEVLELKEKILDKIQDLMVEKNVSADVLVNAMANVMVPVAIMCSQGDKDKLVHIANELRYGIVGQIK